ncbi:MAG: hypothetical protein KKH45_04205 [Proteobacteria bacterium]|nr:hypothetical protein [Pseudomonadota bacterium]
MLDILNHYTLGFDQDRHIEGFFTRDKMPCMSRSLQTEWVCLPAIALAQARRAGCRCQSRSEHILLFKKTI